MVNKTSPDTLNQATHPHQHTRTLCGRLYLHQRGLVRHMQMHNQEKPASTCDQVRENVQSPRQSVETPATTTDHHRHNYHNKDNNNNIQRSPSLINTHQWDVLRDATTLICRRQRTSTTYHQLSTSYQQ